MWVNMYCNQGEYLIYSSTSCCICFLVGSVSIHVYFIMDFREVFEVVGIISNLDDCFPRVVAIPY